MRLRLCMASMFFWGAPLVFADPPHAQDSANSPPSVEKKPAAVSKDPQTTEATSLSSKSSSSQRCEQGAEIERCYDLDKDGAFEKPTDESRKFILNRCRVGAQFTMDLWYTAWLRSAKMPAHY